MEGCECTAGRASLRLIMGRTRVTGLMFLPAAWPMILPTSVLPVNEICSPT